MKPITNEITSFLSTERVGVLTTLLSNGVPHGAAVHYSFVVDPLLFYFSVDITSRKCEQIKVNKKSKAALVLGVSEKDWRTMQLEGEVEQLTIPSDITSVKAIHYQRNPGSQIFDKDPNTIFLRFIPSWWRYSDFNTRPPKIILSSAI